MKLATAFLIPLLAIGVAASADPEPAPLPEHQLVGRATKLKGSGSGGDGGNEGNDTDSSGLVNAPWMVGVGAAAAVVGGLAELW